MDAPFTVALFYIVSDFHRFFQGSDDVYGVTHTTRMGEDYFVMAYDAIKCGNFAMAQFLGWASCNSTHPCPAGFGDCDFDEDCLTGYCETDMDKDEFGTVRGFYVTFLPPGDGK